MTHPARLPAAGRALASAAVSLLVLVLLVSGPGTAARWPGAAPSGVPAVSDGAPVVPRPGTDPRGARMRRYRHAAAYVLGVLAVLAAVLLSTPGAGTGAARAGQESFAEPAPATGRIAPHPDPAGSPA